MQKEILVALMGFHGDLFIEENNQFKINEECTSLSQQERVWLCKSNRLFAYSFFTLF